MEIPEISFNILKFLMDGSTYKSATLTCKLWHTICSTDLRWMIAKYSNHLWTLIKMYPNIAEREYNWDWQGISANPNTTWDLISMSLNATKPWDWSGISRNPNITWEIISMSLTTNNVNWDWSEISWNPNINWDIVCSRASENWNWNGISENPNITPEIILGNLDKPWNWYGIS